MKRKIAAIMAADVAGYSKLVAEDEEETLRRLSSYRAVFEDFIARFSGRIFNTAGDAVLAEFPSAVEAVRCAIDVQESIRTRNLAYLASRHMSFRIGITIGDVVERDGDLLGDGVNIAARLEGLAQPGGLCVSRTVYEQVANKLSVEFVDIGEQAVKNIPTPIHCYSLSLGPEDPRIQKMPQKKKGEKVGTATWPIAIMAASVAALAVVGLFYQTITRAGAPLDQSMTPRVATITAPGEKPRPAQKQGEALVPMAVPFITDRQRAAISAEYLSARGHKALAISRLQSAFITEQKDDEIAKTAALDACQRLTDAMSAVPQCEIYAVGNTVVSSLGRPPMPSEPWVVRNPIVETPFAVKDVPLVNDTFRTNLDRIYHNGHKPWALAVAPQGFGTIFTNQASSDEAVRRTLEVCGSRAGVPCIIMAVDDVFVVPIPSTMKVVGLFHPGGNAAIARDAREDTAHHLANATNGWNAVAVGTNGRPGLMLRAPNERSAVDGALAECGKQDQACHVIAIGPFAVEPKEPPKPEASIR